MALEVQTIVNNAHEYPITCVSLNRARSELYSGSQDNLIKVRMNYSIGNTYPLLTSRRVTRICIIISTVKCQSFASNNGSYNLVGSVVKH